MGAILSYPRFKAFDSNGEFLTGGKLHSYEAGTSIPKATYSDKDCTIANTNPVILDANGEAVVYLSGSYKLVLTDADDVTMWTMDETTGISGTLDDIEDGTNYAKVAKAALSDGSVLLSQAVGYLDDIANGTLYGKVLLSDLVGGHILLGSTIGDLDDIDNGSTYGRVLLTDISAGHILLASAEGDLDDIDDGGTYAKVLATDISAGHILLAAVTGDLDDIADGANYGKVAVTDISSGHILLAAVTGDLDDIEDGTNYGKVALTDISSGHILLASTIGDLDDIANGGTYAKVLATDISAGHILLSSTEGDLDDIDDGTSYGKVLSTVIDSGFISVLRESATSNQRVEIDAGEVALYGNNVKVISINSSGQGSINLLAGSDITLTGHDTNRAKIIYLGTNHSTTMYTISTGEIFYIHPEVTGTVQFRMGSGSYRFSNAYLNVLNNFNLTIGDYWLGFLSDGYFRTANNKEYDWGSADFAIDDYYGDDFNNVADIPFLDDRDDLAYLMDMEGSGIYDERTGLEIINDDKLPDFVKVMKKDGSRKILYDPDGKPYFSVKAMFGWHNGCMRKMNKKIMELEKSIGGKNATR